MTEAEERLAEKLEEDIARVLGAGFAIDDVVIETNGRAHVYATVLAEGHIETIDVEAASVLEAYPELDPSRRRASAGRRMDEDDHADLTSA